MAKDLTIELEHRPGAVAAVAEALGKAGINIDGMFGLVASGHGIGHLLVEDAAGARKAVESAGARVAGERDVVVVEIADRPGELGKLTRRIADAGVNIEAIYMASRTRIAIAADKLDKVREAAKASGSRA
jgi:hypothetical protein